MEHLKTPIHITPSRASQSAIRAVEKLGGTVFCKYYNPLALKDCVKGRTDRTEAAPTHRRDIRTCCMNIAETSSYNSLQSGTPSGRTGDTCRPRPSRRCRWWRSDGKSFRNSSAVTRCRASPNPGTPSSYYTTVSARDIFMRFPCDPQKHCDCGI